MDRNYKIFSDPIYGSIPVDSDICKEIIDTQLFQRLKRIEQTSMCTIFHTARHNRFNHSLGTYYIGDYIFNRLSDNTKSQNPTLFEKIDSFSEIKSISDGPLDWNELGITYRLACLLHDCGHSPFSHTFECYYQRPKDSSSENPKLFDDIIEAYSNSVDCYFSKSEVALTKTQKWRFVSRFKEDLLRCGAKPHELVSAWLVLHQAGFCHQICNLNGCPMLAARMILGCKYSIDRRGPDPFQDEIYNCFIGLLNGDEIDADRTDYAIRDRWATGVNTAKVDIRLLFSSIHIALDSSKNDTPVICFSKKAIPELERILEVKNYNQFWIFTHHTVVYQDRILKKAVEKLALLFCGEESINKYVQARYNDEDPIASGAENESMYTFFDYTSLIKPIHYIVKIDGDEYKEVLYQLSDDDILHLLKKFFCSGINPKDKNLREIYDRNNYALEWFSRNYKFIPLWKSYVEFCNSYLNHHFELITIRSLLKELRSCSENGLKEVSLEGLMKNDDLKAKIEVLRKHKGADNTLDFVLSIHSNTIPLNRSMIDTFQSILDSYENGMKGDFKNCLERSFENLKDEGFIPTISASKIIDEQVVQLKSVKTHGIFLDLRDEYTDNTDANVIKCYTDLDIPVRNQPMLINFFYAFLPILKSERGKELSKKESRKLYTRELQKQIEQIYHQPREWFVV